MPNREFSKFRVRRKPKTNLRSVSEMRFNDCNADSVLPKTNRVRRVGTRIASSKRFQIKQFTSGLKVERKTDSVIKPVKCVLTKRNSIKFQPTKKQLANEFSIKFEISARNCGCLRLPQNFSGGIKRFAVVVLSRAHCDLNGFVKEYKSQDFSGSFDAQG